MNNAFATLAESRDLWLARSGYLRLDSGGQVYWRRWGGRQWRRVGSIENTGLDYRVPAGCRADLAKLLDEWRSSTSREDLHREWRRDYRRGLL